VFFHPGASFAQIRLGRKMGAKPRLSGRKSGDGW
jgi:hypothetical protein